jgi:hypothetical protein
MEKRGHVEKLRYDFNTARAVYVKNPKNDYVRITERDFRSHNGERYIFMKSNHNDYEYIPYEGPIYYWNTNKICREPIGDNRIQYAHEKPWKSLLRPHENKR